MPTASTVTMTVRHDRRPEGASRQRLPVVLEPDPRLVGVVPGVAGRRRPFGEADVDRDAGREDDEEQQQQLAGRDEQPRDLLLGSGAEPAPRPDRRPVGPVGSRSQPALPPFGRVLNLAGDSRPGCPVRPGLLRSASPVRTGSWSSPTPPPCSPSPARARSASSAPSAGCCPGLACTRARHGSRGLAVPCGG